MFPFPTPYQVYSGTCVGNDPSKYIPNYFAGRPSSVVQLTPGGPAVSADVFEPALDVTMKYTRSSGTVDWPGATTGTIYGTVYAYPKTTGCATAPDHARLHDEQRHGEDPAARACRSASMTSASTSSAAAPRTGPAGRPWRTRT